MKQEEQPVEAVENDFDPYCPNSGPNLVLLGMIVTIVLVLIIAFLSSPH
jgi:hypothetical protein